MKLIIDNRDLAYTIDTYGTFTVDDEYDSEYEYYLEEYGLKDIDFDFDHTGYVKHLAEISVDILQENLTGRYGNSLKVVNSIKLLETKSPQFYNYTTDSYTAEWDINFKLLKKYVLDNWNEYEAFTRENWTLVDSNVNWHDKTYIKTGEYQAFNMFDNEDVIVSMLDFWTRQEYSEDEYIDAMFENRIATDFILLDDDSRAKLEAIESKV